MPAPTASPAAGLALDAEIAQRVFGWKRIRPTMSYEGGTVGDPPGEHLSRELPRYSQDIAAAWAVVEHVADHAAPGQYEHFKALMGAPGISPWAYRAPALAAAICRAALAAVEPQP